MSKPYPDAWDVYFGHMTPKEYATRQAVNLLTFIAAIHRHPDYPNPR